MSHLKVALLGYGAAGEHLHAPLIQATVGFELAAIVTSDPQRSSRAAGRYPNAAVLGNSEQLWHDAATYDLAVIATPNATHVDLGVAALNCGLPVVIDKPMATTTAEAQQLVELARAAGLMLTVFQNRRWDSDFLALRELIDRGDLGTVWRFESRFERWRPQLKPGWRESGEPSEGGGILADLGSHLVDQAVLLFGPAATVYATLDHRREGAAVEDDAFIAMTHVSGVRSTLWTSAVAAQSGPRLRVLGSGGAYVVEGLDGQEEALRSGADPAAAHWGRESRGRWGRLVTGERVRAVARGPGAYPRFYAEVRGALTLGGPVPVDPSDAVMTQRILDAARRSAQRDKVVKP